MWYHFPPTNFIPLLVFGLIIIVNVSGTSVNDTKTTQPPTQPPTVATTKVVTTQQKTTKAKAPTKSAPKTTKDTPTTKKSTAAPLTTKAPTPPPKVNCSLSATCAACSKNYNCYWCDPHTECLEYPSGRIIPKGCPKNDWYWKQCVISGYVLIIVVPVVAGLLLLCLGCCIYCKCCRSTNKNWKREEEKINAKRQERELRAQERKSERKKTTDALRMKYGLLKSDDEEQLIT